MGWRRAAAGHGATAGHGSARWRRWDRKEVVFYLFFSSSSGQDFSLFYLNRGVMLYIGTGVTEYYSVTSNIIAQPFFFVELCRGSRLLSWGSLLLLFHVLDICNTLGKGGVATNTDSRNIREGVPTIYVR